MKNIITLITIVVLFCQHTNTYAFDNLIYPETKHKTTENKNDKKSISKISNSKNQKTKNANKVELTKTKNQKKNPSKTNNSNDGALAISFGIISFILGGLVLWYLSIFFGALLMILGLTLLIIGIVQFSRFNNANKHFNSTPSPNNYIQKNTPPTYNYKDVVYLKNGSIIKGIITEQIMNVSIKIETGDGSVFFYKMEEVEKLVKEIVR